MQTPRERAEEEVEDDGVERGERSGILRAGWCVLLGFNGGKQRRDGIIKKEDARGHGRPGRIEEGFVEGRSPLSDGTYHSAMNPDPYRRRGGINFENNGQVSERRMLEKKTRRWLVRGHGGRR